MDDLLGSAAAERARRGTVLTLRSAWPPQRVAAAVRRVAFLPVEVAVGQLLEVIVELAIAGGRPLVMAAEMRAEKLPEEFVETILTGWWTTCLEVLPPKERAFGRF